MNFLVKYWDKILILFFSIVVVVLAFSFAIDIKAKEIIDDSLAQAIVVFGSAKALNAVISLAQGTELDLPFLTVAIGEVLDPINDLIEQFSLIMLASMTSLGIQKILMAFVTNKIFNIVLVFCLTVVNIWLFLRFKKDERVRSLFFKITVILVFLRFAIPFIGFVNEVTYHYFVKPEYNIEKLNENIVKAKDEVSKVTNETIMQKQQSSFFDKVVEKFDSAYYSKKVDEYRDAAEDSSQYIVDLITVFVFQTILLPIIFLLVLYYFIKGIFNIGR
jgi:hypothetical protein